MNKAMPNHHFTLYGDTTYIIPQANTSQNDQAA